MVPEGARALLARVRGAQTGPEQEPYQINSELGGSKRSCVVEAESFWASCPEYRSAELDMIRTSRESLWIVLAKFPEGEGPEPLGSTWRGDRRWDDGIFRGWEEHMSLVNGGMYRVVFCHPEHWDAQHFCTCVETYQALEREEVFTSAVPGDGSVDSQWGEVFGGGPQ